MNVTIVGLGEYFKKIYKGINRSFKIISVIDNREFNELNIDPSLKTIFSNNINEAFLKKSECFIILSPPNSHKYYLKLFLPLQKIIFIEKPTLSNVAQFDKIFFKQGYKARVYFSDYYLDVRALPLFHWLKKKTFSDLTFISNHSFYKFLEKDFGNIKMVSGILLESDSPNSLFRSSWLSARNGGGVLLDLMWHFFMLSFKLFENLTKLEMVKLSSQMSKTDNVTKSPADAEMAAIVRGVFDNKVPFLFEVNKSSSVIRKEFKITFENGTATMIFGNKNELILENSEKIQISSILVIDYHDAVALCFRTFAESTFANHNLELSYKTQKAIENIKKFNLS